MPARGLEAELQWTVVGDGIEDRSENELEIWYGSQDRFAVAVKPPAGSDWITVRPRQFVENFRLPSGTTLSIYNSRRSRSRSRKRSGCRGSPPATPSTSPSTEPFHFWFSTTAEAQEAGSARRRAFEGVEARVEELRQTAQGELVVHYNEGASIELAV